MKRIKILSLLLIAFFAFNMNVFAAPEGHIEFNKSSVHVGESFKVNVNLTTVASWSVKVTLSDKTLVENSCILDLPDPSMDNYIINEVGDTGNNSNQTKTFSATCKAKKVGTLEATLGGDVTAAEDGTGQTEETVDLSETVTINITEAPATPTPSPSVKPTPSKTPTPSKKPNNGGSGSKISNNPKTATPLIVLLLISIILGSLSIVRYNSKKKEME